MQKFTIMGRLPSRNEAERAARTHWAVGAKLKKDATEAVAWAAVSQHIKPENGSVVIEVTFYEKDYRRDEDNVQSGIKYILDGLVAARIIPNDTRRFVRLNTKPVEVDKKNPRIEVVIYKEQEQAGGENGR